MQRQNGRPLATPSRGGKDSGRAAKAVLIGAAGVTGGIVGAFVYRSRPDGTSALLLGAGVFVALLCWLYCKVDNKKAFRVMVAALVVVFGMGMTVRDHPATRDTAKSSSGMVEAGVSSGATGILNRISEGDRKQAKDSKTEDPKTVQADGSR